MAEKYNVIEILLEILDFDPITTAVPNKPAASKNEASTPRPKKIKRKVFPSPPRIAPSPERGLGGMDFHLTPSRIGPTPVMSGEESSPITRNRSSGGAHALASYNEEYLAQENFSYQKKRRKRELKDQLKSNIYFSPKNPPLSVREDLLTKIDTTTTYQQEEETMAEIHQRNLLRSPSHHRGIMLMEVLRRPPIQLSHQQRQGEILMCIWNDSPFPDILNLLRNPLVPYQFDINFLLDQEGNTCIHWAAALGKVDLLKSLIRHGANTDMVNKWGQSPIIGAVKLMHSYHVQTFSQLIDILRPCVYKIDSENKTLLHHISERAFTSLQSSFYYMHCITFWLDTKGDDTLFEFLNHQDDQGDTSLHISCRARAYLVSDLLVSLGAKKDIQNIHGENVWKVSLGDHRMFKILRSGEKVKKYIFKIYLKCYNSTRLKEEILLNMILKPLILMRPLQKRTILIWMMMMKKISKKNYQLHLDVKHPNSLYHFLPINILDCGQRRPKMKKLMKGSRKVFRIQN